MARVQGRRAEWSHGYQIGLIVEALQALYRRGMRAVELADALGVTDRTVYRMLKTFRSLGVPLRAEDGSGIRRWCLDPVELAGWLVTGKKRTKRRGGKTHGRIQTRKR